MAEALGVAASAVAMIGLAANVVRLGYRFHEYVRDIRQAPKDIQKLMNELQSLTPVLVALRDYAVDNPESENLQALCVGGGPLQECTQELQVLEQKLTPRKGWKKKIDVLTWPLKENETLQHISVIERHKTLFNLALTIDHISLSKVIKQYAQRTWTIVQDIETYAQDTHAIVQTIEASVRQTNETIREILEEATAQNVEGRARINVEERDTVLNWLFADDFNRRHVEIKAKRQKDTGEWILRRSEFQDWGSENSKSRLLWGSGIPGAGKTFLSSMIVDHFQAQKQTNNYGIAHIYFDYKEQGAQSPIRVLSSLVKQLATQIATLPTSINKLYMERDKKVLTTEELYSAFLEVSKSFPRVFLIFDALDECHPEDQRGPLLPIFQQMVTDGINIFLASRPHPEDIQDALSDAVRIELSAQQDDIRTYITKRIEENSRARRLVKQAKCKDRIISELTDCAKGMFLLVRFHVDYICQQTNAKQVLAALEELKKSPGGTKRPLYPTYERAMNSIKGQDTNLIALAYAVFSWLIKAKRTLTVEELRVAVAIEQDRYEIDDMDLPDRMTLMDACAGLVVIDESSDTVKLAHYTVQEYLVENSILHTDAGFRLAMACTTYLSFDSLDGSCTSLESLRERFKYHPFLEYASNFIGVHLQDCDEHLTTSILFRFLRNSGNIDSYRQASVYQPQQRDCGRNEGCIPLYIASSFAHVTAIKLLLEEGADVSDRNENGETALHAASTYGYTAVASLLLDKGADTSATGESGLTPLSYAIFNGHKAIVSLLLDKGADISATDNIGDTPLHSAVFSRNEEIVSLLLEKGADISAADESGLTSLYYAIYNGHEAIVSLLLDKGADISATDKHGFTPLHNAILHSHEAVVSLLLDKGADISAADKLGYKPLHNAIFRGYESIVSLLLDKGADISATDESGYTPLKSAISNRNEAMVSLLLDKGADIPATDNIGFAPLYYAIFRGYEEIVSLLLDKGADISATDESGFTPLHSAIFNGHEPIVSLLLEKGADISATDKNGNTPLHHAVSNGHKEIASLLLDKGADISAADKSGSTPLHSAICSWNEAISSLLFYKGAHTSATDESGFKSLHSAVFNRHGAIVGLLLEKGADISATDKRGYTPLHYAVLKGNKSVASLLLENGADVLSRNNHNSTPLALAAIGGDEDTVQLLLEKGADLFARDKDGDTPLHEAALWGHTSVVRLLLKEGAHISAAGKAGMTPLHWAASRGREAVVNFLLTSGADICSIDNDGYTPLHLAASSAHEAVVKSLLENGANASALNHSGQTALQVAAAKGHAEVVSILEAL